MRFANGSRHASLDEGLRSDGLTSSEREELSQLGRENRVLREEREILSWFAEETGATSSRRSQSEEPPSRASNRRHVPRAGRLPWRLLRAAEKARLRADPKHQCPLTRIQPYDIGQLAVELGVGMNLKLSIRCGFGQYTHDRQDG
jgi:hypothetical protein